MTKKSELPPGCSLCAPYGGAWAMAPGGGMQRCDCPRGKALSEMAAQHEHSARWGTKPRRRVRTIVRDYKMLASGGNG
jgi:hypothetical protein